MQISIKGPLHSFQIGWFKHNCLLQYFFVIVVAAEFMNFLLLVNRIMLI